MAQGASINISVSPGIVNILRQSRAQLERMGIALQQVTGWALSAKMAMRGQGNITQVVQQRMSRLSGVMGQYTGATASATGATSALTGSLMQAAGFIHKMSIGLYVIGGSFTRLARAGMAASMAINFYQMAVSKGVIKEQPIVNKYISQLKSSFKSMGRTIMSVGRRIKTAFLGGVTAIGRFLRKIPLVGGAITTLKTWFASLGATIKASLGPITIITALVTAVTYGMAKLGRKFADVSHKLKRVIIASDIGTDQFGALATTTMQLQKQMKVFETIDIAGLLEKMAYAGALNEQFRETAKSIGRIAYISEIGIEEITRDLARLRDQTGKSFNRLSEVILATFTQASITYEDTVDSFMQAGMILQSNLGVTLEQVGATAIALSYFGYTGSRAATAIRSIAAEASQLKSGLEDTQGILSKLGISEVFKRFKKGQATLIDLLKAMGQAGASFGQMTSVFNRRAAVMANAIAKNYKAFDKFVQKIEDSQDNVKEAMQELINSQKGFEDQVKATRSRMVQEYARLFSGVTRQWDKSKKLLFNIFATVGSWLNYLVDLSQIAASIMMTAFQAAMTEFETRARQAFNSVVSLFQHIIRLGKKVGFGDYAEGAAKALDIFKFELPEKSAKEYFAEVEKLVQEFKDRMGGVYLDLGDQADQQKQLERAQKEYRQSVVSATESLEKFEGAIQAERLLALMDQLAVNLGIITTSGRNWERTVESVQQRFKEITRGSRETFRKELPKLFNTLMETVTGDVRALLTLQKTVTYVKERFGDLQDQLKDLFGLTRTITRRHGAIVRPTGEVIGKTRVGEREVGGAMAQILGIEERSQAKAAIKRLEGIEEAITTTLIQAYTGRGTAEPLTQYQVLERIMEQVMGEKLEKARPFVGPKATEERLSRYKTMGGTHEAVSVPTKQSETSFTINNEVNVNVQDPDAQDIAKKVRHELDGFNREMLESLLKAGLDPKALDAYLAEDEGRVYLKPVWEEE